MAKNLFSVVYQVPPVLRTLATSCQCHPIPVIKQSGFIIKIFCAEPDASLFAVDPQYTQKEAGQYDLASQYHGQH